MQDKLKIPRRISAALVGALGAGVVPRVGLEHVAVGRKAEVEALLRDLEATQEGGAAFRLVVGRYGSGKSFLMQILRNQAMDRGFVVADADLSPERRLTGGQGQGLATYRELMTHLATRARPDGGALEVMLQRWMASLQAEAARRLALPATDERVRVAVEADIVAETAQMEGLVHGFDFARVVTAYWRACATGEEEPRQAALRWLRGEVPTRTEAKRALDVNAIIDDDSWYDYVKLWARFCARIGYKGLVVLLDEAVNLYKITHTVSRNANYEKLLTLLNDTLQGKASHLAIYVGGTPQFVEDSRRGLYSYEALRSRLTGGRYGAGLRNLASPILQLQMLSQEEIALLLQKLRALHAVHYGYEPSLSDEQIIRFMENELGRLGAGSHLTPREVIRDFLGLMDVLLQNPEAEFDRVLGQPPAAEEPPKDDLLTGFDL